MGVRVGAGRGRRGRSSARVVRRARVREGGTLGSAGTSCADTITKDLRFEEAHFNRLGISLSYTMFKVEYLGDRCQINLIKN